MIICKLNSCQRNYITKRVYWVCVYWFTDLHKLIGVLECLAKDCDNSCGQTPVEDKGYLAGYSVK